MGQGDCKKGGSADDGALQTLFPLAASPTPFSPQIWTSKTKHNISLIAEHEAYRSFLLEITSLFGTATSGKEIWGNLNSAHCFSFQTA